jgi:tetratricopeptide (TPR) repeat protein
MAELPGAVHGRIQALCAKGDNLAKKGEYPAALEQYWAAWGLLPEPQTNWAAATWILAAIGDANFLGGDFTAGRDNLSMAMHCPDAIGNPFLHLRLGQCQFELGNLDRAADELARAYMGAGKDIFQGADPKYLAFLKTRLQPPPGGW